MSRYGYARIMALVLGVGLGITDGWSAQSRAKVIAHAPDSLELRSDNSLLLLRAGVFDPAAQQLDLNPTGVAMLAPELTSRYAIVQFLPGIQKIQDRLQQAGAELVSYVPNNAYLIRLGGQGLAAVRADPAVRFAGSFEPGMKLDPALWTNERAKLGVSEYGEHQIEIQGFAGESAQRLLSALQKRIPDVGVTSQVERSTGPRLRVRVKPEQLALLLQTASGTEGVAWIAPYRLPHLMNDGAPGPMQANTLSCGIGLCGPTPLWDHQILGTGQIVGIADSGLDRNEAWFTDYNNGTGLVSAITDAVSPVPPAIGVTHPGNKIFAYWVQPSASSYDNNASCSGGPATAYHGTHTSGTLAGDASGTFGLTTYTASSPTSAGHDANDSMAPNAQILFQDIGDDTTGCLSGADDVRTLLEQAYAGGVRVHSDSWGSSNQGAYASEDADVDYEMWTLENMVIAIAAGNDGAPGPSIGSPGNAKNAVTVGALGHASSLSVASYSSRGPTADGRLKPDIMAPGTSTVSASGDSNNSATIEAPVSKSLSGTSMATPTIAGNTVLLRQFFSDGYYPRGAKTAADTLNPSGMLMKAVMLNGTNPISASNWFSNNYGWGRMWLDSNLWFSSTTTGGDDNRRMRYWERTNATGLVQGEQHQYLITVAAGQELRVTLTWYDPEGAPGAALALVNNLDLEVVAPGGMTTYKGNVFTSGVSTAGGTADSRNTVEQVRLTAPVAGSYTLRVNGTSIPGNGRAYSDRQGYALVVSGAFGLPDPTPYPAPTGLSVTSNNSSGIAIGFSAMAGAQSFELYRAAGTCASAAQGDFRMVASNGVSPVVDDHTQGGYSYAYQVRGVQNDVEGAHSACLDVVSNDICALFPNFSEASIQRSQQNSSCSVALNWNTGSSQCPAASGVSYSVYRDSNPYFTAPTRIANNLSALTFTDSTLTHNAPYYYRVSAVDSAGNESLRQRTLNATTLGPGGADGGSFIDDVDTHAYMDMSTPWRITNQIASAGSYSYHNGGDNQTYPASVCAAITTPNIVVQPGAILNFKARYDLEYQWDGVVLEISTNGGSSWNDLPPDGGYPNTFAQTGTPPINNCAYPTSQGAFTGKTTTVSNADSGNGTGPTPIFKAFTANLASYAGQTIKLRWRFSSDGGAEFEGFSLDEVTLGGIALDRTFKDAFEGGPVLTCY